MDIECAFHEATLEHALAYAKRGWSTFPLHILANSQGSGAVGPALASAMKTAGRTTLSLRKQEGRS